ncbi:MAG: hypothetical protein R3F62_09995 [Planctomycetota bacterium]
MERDLQTARERDRFLRNLEQAGSRTTSSSPAPATPSVAANLPSLTPTAHTSVHAIQRLQDMSDYLVGFGLILLALAATTGLVLAFGSDLDGVWRVFGFLASTLVGVFMYVFLKCVADAMRALADVGELGRSLELRLHAMQDIIEQEFSDNAG